MTTLQELQQRTEALGLTDDDEQYIEIKKLAVTMDPDNLKLAKIKIKKLEDAKMPKAKTETEEERINRLVEEKLRVKLQEAGMLQPEGAKPSGGSGFFTASQIANMTDAEYTSKRLDIEKAMREGRFNPNK